MTREDPPTTAAEAETLLGFLRYHRETLRMKADGLDAAQLATALPPSTLTLGGLLHHLALVESSWSAEVFAGGSIMEPFASADWQADQDWEFTVAPQVAPEVLRARWEVAVAAADAVYAAALSSPTGLDSLSVRTSRHTGEQFSLRWILLHLVEEYARHNGHADLIREAVDGSVGE